MFTEQPHQGYAMFFHGEHLILQRTTQTFILPSQHSHTIGHQPGHASTTLYVGQFNHEPLHAIHQENFQESADYCLIPVRDVLVTLVDAALSKLLCRAKQLLAWHRASLFCGYCGAPTHMSAHEICKVCQACSARIYPYTSPAIIVLIRRHDDILLGRSPHFSPGMYSTLAGFVDPGESCEEAVAREIHEEVGLYVQNIRYFGSQAWPFPNSFMLGFQADYAAGEICINPHELEDAAWFNRNHLPIIPPPYSIARRMIDHFLKEQ